jgi:hypothetical protein
MPADEAKAGAVASIRCERSRTRTSLAERTLTQHLSWPPAVLSGKVAFVEARFTMCLGLAKLFGKRLSLLAE